MFITCPRGEIGRHKGLKILAHLGVPVRVWPRAPKDERLYEKMCKEIVGPIHLPIRCTFISCRYARDVHEENL